MLDVPVEIALPDGEKITPSSGESGRPWSADDDKILLSLRKIGKSIDHIAALLGRSYRATQCHAAVLGLTVPMASESVLRQPHIVARIKSFIGEVGPGNAGNPSIAAMVQREFGLVVTKGQVAGCLSREKITRSGVRGPRSHTVSRNLPRGEDHIPLAERAEALRIETQTPGLVFIDGVGLVRRLGDQATLAGAAAPVMVQPRREVDIEIAGTTVPPADIPSPSQAGQSPAKTPAELRAITIRGMQSRAVQGPYDTSRRVRPMGRLDALSGPIGAPSACQWPIGDPRDAGFRFCEAPSYTDRQDHRRPYCLDHCRKAWDRFAG